MKRTSAAVVMAVILVASASLALAQGPGGAGGGRRQGGMGRQGGFMAGGMGGGLGMLRIPEVQQELKMTPAQIAKIDEAQQAVREAMAEAFQGGFRNMTPEEQQRAAGKVEEIQEKAVASILDQTQLKRYKELQLQQMGAMALLRPSVARELGLTEQQTARLREIQQKQQQEMRDMFQNASPEERQQMFQRMQELRKKNDEALLAVLTPAQKTKWTQMQGAPFKFPERRPGMFGGGRRPGGGPGGPGGPGGAPPSL